MFAVCLCSLSYCKVKQRQIRFKAFSWSEQIFLYTYIIIILLLPTVAAIYAHAITSIRFQRRGGILLIISGFCHSLLLAISITLVQILFNSWRGLFLHKWKYSWVANDELSSALFFLNQSNQFIIIFPPNDVLLHRHWHFFGPCWETTATGLLMPNATPIGCSSYMVKLDVNTFKLKWTVCISTSYSLFHLKFNVLQNRAKSM